VEWVAPSLLRCWAQVFEMGSASPSRGRARVITGPPDPTGCDIVVNEPQWGCLRTIRYQVSADLLTSSMFVGDVVAGYGITSFLQAARAPGCKTCDGVQMIEAGNDIMPDFLLCT